MKNLLSKLKDNAKRVALAGMAIAALSGGMYAYSQHGPKDEDPPARQQYEEYVDSNQICTISGRLESNEQDGVLQPGFIRIYEKSSKKLLAEQYSTDGIFNFSIPYKSKFVLQAQLNDNIPETKDGYVRTIFLNGSKNYENLLVRAVPKNDFFVSKKDFKQFVYEVNGTDIYEASGKSYSEGLKRFDLKNLKGIEILLSNPYKSLGSFTPEQQKAIAESITSSNGVEALIDGFELDKYVQIDNSSTPWSSKHYSSKTNGNIKADDGWIVVYPNNNQSHAGSSYIDPSSNCMSKASISLLPSLGDYLIQEINNHEWAYLFINPMGHSKILNRTYTITFSPSFLSEPGAVDIKTGKIVYEDTYSAGEDYDNILGLNWYDGTEIDVNSFY